jgi:hypothetical protein
MLVRIDWVERPQRTLDTHLKSGTREQSAPAAFRKVTTGGVTSHPAAFAWMLAPWVACKVGYVRRNGTGREFGGLPDPLSFDTG